ncbi:hypothetical protein, partial [Corynebacterium glyciniphilum]|uniref:hypothetical protein n=1 Tax=Corynebacterium glyciniphilum TaxID=1404244 RepID=UPI001C92F5D4
VWGMDDLAGAEKEWMEGVEGEMTEGGEEVLGWVWEEGEGVRVGEVMGEMMKEKMGEAKEGGRRGWVGCGSGGRVDGRE